MRFCCLLVLSMFSWTLHAKEIQTHNKVCFNPSQPCANQVYQFQPHELSFKLPAQLEWQSGYYSAEFYAVILRSMKATENYDYTSDEPCTHVIDESERLAVQATFPNNKVFTSRNGCPSMVFYTNTNDKYNFIAVYAGANKQEASKILAQAKTAGFIDASLRRMQVIVDNGD